METEESKAMDPADQKTEPDNNEMEETSDSAVVKEERDENSESEKNEGKETGDGEGSGDDEMKVDENGVKKEPEEGNTDAASKDGEAEAAKAKIDEEEWSKNVLLVSGMPPGEAGSLKQLLNTTLGADCHRIKPRIRGDRNLYVLFRTHNDMKVAESLLHNQKFLKYKLTAKVEDGPVQHKRSVSREKKDEPPFKKPKPDISGQQFLEGKYEDQIAFKMEDVQMKLHKVAKLLQASYPKYGGLIFHRQLKYDGIICELTEFKKCPPDECFATRCKFAIGLDEETGQPAVGVRVAKAEPSKGENAAPTVKDITKVNHNYPQHVIDAAKVFEKAVQTSEKAPGKCKFWHELIIRTNIAQDLMLLVFVHCMQDSAADELKKLNEELKEFFENGEGKECRLVALFTKAVCTDVARPQQQSGVMELVLGNPYLEETVMGFKLHLLPMMYFWNSVHAAKMVCEGIKELLAPSEKTSILEIGCGIGLIGFYLSKFAGEVLSVDVDHLVEEASKNAERNEIKNVFYHPGKAEEVIPNLTGNLHFDKACAIVISSVNRFSTCPKAMEELRKIEKVKRIVLVTEMSTSRFSPIISLARSTVERGLGNPFFPVKAIPVDTMPHSRSYVLLVLLERIGLKCLPKTVKKPGPSRLTMAELRMSKKEKRKVFFSKNGGANWQGGRRFMFEPVDQFQVGPYDYSPNEYHLQQMLAEERRRRMEVEDQRRWLQEEQRRRRIDERKRNNPVTDLISDSLKEAGVPQLDPDATQKLKLVIAEAIKSAGVLGKDKEPNDSGNTYRGGNWSQTPAGQAAKQGPQPLLDIKTSDPYTRRPYPQQYGGNAPGYGQPPGAKPFYASGQDNIWPGRQGNGPPNWNYRENVQYPLANMYYGPGKNTGNTWQGSGPSYQTYTSGENQRGGYRNMNQGNQRYFS